MDFLGRNHELKLIEGLTTSDNSKLTVLYGRRRVGKTRLVEEACRGKKLLKFEGMEGQPTHAQQMEFLKQLSKQTGRHELAKIKTNDWTDILITLSNNLGHKHAVVLFDEFQWMAAERTKLVSAFKYVWDNYFRQKNRIHAVICGSISSFLVNKVIRSKALYGRVDLEINLRPLNIQDIKPVFAPPRSILETVELYLCMGGIPQYLQMVNPKLSAKKNIESLCFAPNGYLVHDFERIFTSHFGKTPHYKNILMTLAHMKHASRVEIETKCKLQGGGRLSQYLDELELAGFIESYNPVHKIRAERLKRYRLSDFYLLFYFRFIYPSSKKIAGDQSSGISKYISEQQYAVWRGLAFEYFCYQHHNLIAQKLGFAAVNYDCGPWFVREDLGKGAQIDMLFIRADRVITLCEIKFQKELIGKGVIKEVEEKVQRLPNPSKRTIERVLITASPPTNELLDEGYFHRVLTIDELVG